MFTINGQQLVGKVLGACTLEKILGYGGTSIVFLAQQHTPQRKVAVKVFLPRTNMTVQMQRDFYRRFLHEAEAASELEHPNILSIYSYGEQDGLPYIIMTYMPGGTLYEYVSEHGPLPLSEAQSYLEQISSALDYAHQHGCIHCDVKPANILLNGEGHVVLSDFGIARAVQLESSSSRPPARNPETLMGTPNYISPEQALGLSLDGRSDVYSLGITLFFLLMSYPPFKADTGIALALLHVHQAPPSLFSLRSDISAQMDRVFNKALAKRPEDRFQSAGEFSAAFVQAALASQRSEPGDTTAKRLRVAVKESCLLAQATTLTKPSVHVKAVSVQRSISRPVWIAFAVILLLIGILGATFTATLVKAHTTHQTSPVQATVPAGIDTGVLADGLANNEHAWPTGSTFFFVHGQYHIQNKSAKNVALALCASYSFANLRLSVTTSEVHGLHDGGDYYGVVFRSTADQSHYYLFEVVAWNGGQYAFLRYDGQWHTLATGPAPALRTQTGQHNTITVQAKDHTFSFLINGQPVGHPVSDTSPSGLTSGEIGLYVEEQYAEVAFSHLQITPLN